MGTLFSEELDGDIERRLEFVDQLQRAREPLRRFTMGEVMTLLEIQSSFDAEWVLMEDPEVTESLQVKRGKVLWHSKDRDEVYHKARELRPKHSAILYTGRLPAGTVVVL